MSNEIILAAVLSAKAQINLVRFRFTQFNLPISDAKLIRISNYLTEEAAKVEALMWKEAEL